MDNLTDPPIVMGIKRKKGRRKFVIAAIFLVVVAILLVTRPWEKKRIGPLVIPNGPQASVGLYWFLNSDPTAGAGIPAPLYQFLVRTDNNSFYFKSGLADTAWTLIGTAGGGTIGGGGTVGTIPVWTGALAIGNSAATDDGTTFKISTTKWTLVEASGNETVAGTGSFGGALNMNSHLVDNVTDPVSNQDAATKHYVDTQVATATEQLVLYTVTGSEGASFNVNLGVATANNRYGLWWAPAGMVSVPTSLDLPIAGRTTLLFPVTVGAPLVAGDKIQFFVLPQP